MVKVGQLWEIIEPCPDHPEFKEQVILILVTAITLIGYKVFFPYDKKNYIL